MDKVAMYKEEIYKHASLRKKFKNAIDQQGMSDEEFSNLVKDLKKSNKGLEGYDINNIGKKMPLNISNFNMKTKKIKSNQVKRYESQSSITNHGITHGIFS